MFVEQQQKNKIDTYRLYSEVIKVIDYGDISLLVNKYNSILKLVWFIPFIDTMQHLKLLVLILLLCNVFAQKYEIKEEIGNII